MLRIHEIKLGVGEDINTIPRRMIRKINVKGLEIADFQLVKESIDARNKAEIKRVYSVDFTPALPGKNTAEAEEYLLEKVRGVKLEPSPDTGYHPVLPGREKLEHPPVIAGFGPCGMFAGLILAEMGYEPVILERGKPIGERIRDVERFWTEGILDPESNVQFGEGEQACFPRQADHSDQGPKSEKGTGRVRGSRCGSGNTVQAKAPYRNGYPEKVVFNIRRKITENGGKILFHHRLSDMTVGEMDGMRKIRGVVINETDHIDTEALILAVGHSARDTFRMLARNGLPWNRNHFPSASESNIPSPWSMKPSMAKHGKRMISEQRITSSPIIRKAEEGSIPSACVQEAMS
jgi:uncharacterized FAD-dependent dehydrogenase